MFAGTDTLNGMYDVCNWGPGSVLGGRHIISIKPQRPKRLCTRVLEGDQAVVE